MKIPSRELLSAVLGKNVKMVITDIKVIHGQLNSSVKNSEIAISYDDKWTYENIYELMHLMKEWAYEPTKRYLIYSVSGQLAEAYISNVFDLSQKNDKHFQGGSEFEAVTKACEYILEQTNESE